MHRSLVETKSCLFQRSQRLNYELYLAFQARGLFLQGSLELTEKASFSSLGGLKNTDRSLLTEIVKTLGTENSHEKFDTSSWNVGEFLS